MDVQNWLFIYLSATMADIAFYCLCSLFRIYFNVCYIGTYKIMQTCFQSFCAVKISDRPGWPISGLESLSIVIFDNTCDIEPQIKFFFINCALFHTCMSLRPTSLVVGAYRPVLLHLQLYLDCEKCMKQKCIPIPVSEKKVS